MECKLLMAEKRNQFLPGVSHSLVTTSNDDKVAKPKIVSRILLKDFEKEMSLQSFRYCSSLSLSLMVGGVLDTSGNTRLGISSYTIKW